MKPRPNLRKNPRGSEDACPHQVLPARHAYEESGRAASAADYWLAEMPASKLGEPSVTGPLRHRNCSARGPPPAQDVPTPSGDSAQRLRHAKWPIDNVVNRPNISSCQPTTKPGSSFCSAAIQCFEHSCETAAWQQYSLASTRRFARQRQMIGLT
jgi:hypothetical protein